MRGRSRHEIYARKLALIAIVLAVSLPVIDSTIANIALPSIAASLHASRDDVIWVVTAYNLAIILALMPAGAFSEIFGYGAACRLGSSCSRRRR